MGIKKQSFEKLLILLLPILLFIQNPTKAQNISPYLFGQNMWLTDGAEGRPGYINEFLWSKVEKSGVKLIRIGGNDYNKNMPSIKTLTAWIKGIKAIGAEPLLQVSEYQSAEKAAQLVNYFNKETDLNIKFWCIGNEPSHIDKKETSEIYDTLKAHSTAMKKVDPTIKIFAPDFAYYIAPGYEDLLGGNYDISGKDENGNYYIDGVTFHSYPNNSEYNRDSVVFHSANKIENMIIPLIKRMEFGDNKNGRTGNNKLLWGITEFNITYDNPPNMEVDGISVPSLINGQFWAEIFGLSMKYNAFTAAPWCIQESDRQQTYFGYVGAPPDFIPHSTYYHLQMMAENMSGNYLPTASNHKYVKTIASINNSKITILIMNQSLEEDFEFEINLSKNGKTDKPLIITADTGISDSINDKIKKQSSLMIIYDIESKRIEKINYSLDDHARKNIAPTKS